MSLRSDSLLAVTGLFPKDITAKEHAAAATVPDTWTRRLTQWVKAEEQAPFVYVPPKADMDKVFEQLAIPPAELEVAGWLEGLGVDDIELQADYFTALMRAREHVTGAWPKHSIDGPTGPRLLPLSQDDAEEVWGLIKVLDDPERLLEEMRCWTLTTSQALAFRTCYPDLYAHANQAIDTAIIDKRAKDDDFTLGVERESVLNVFRGMPPEEAPLPPPAPPAPPGKFQIDPEKDRTQAEVSGAPKARK